MRVLAAANLLGVSADTLRNWERLGVITPKRDRLNHRRYSDEDIEAARRYLFGDREHLAQPASGTQPGAADRHRR